MLNQQKMKNLIVKKSKESKIPVQQMYGLYAMDRLILKLSETEFADNLIVKGGFLLTTDLGVSMRSTRDLDFTVKNFLLDENKINKLIDAIETKEENDNEYFEFKSISETRGDFDYNGYNLKLIYRNGNTKIPINVDITSGEDIIAVQDKKRFKSIFTDEVYMLCSYSLEQVISDKFYTLLAYGNVDDTNSRMKDYYDLYLLTKMNKALDLDKVVLGLGKTMNQRDNFIHANDYELIIDDLSHSDRQKELWSVFSGGTPYAENLTFEEVMGQIKFFSNKLINRKVQKGIETNK